MSRGEEQEGQVAPVQGELLQYARRAVRQDFERRREREVRRLLGIHALNAPVVR